MAFKTYPQPPFKAYVKLKNGKILKPNYKSANIYPAVYNKRGCPLLRFGWEIMYGSNMYDKKTGEWIGHITMSDVIVATADSEEELQ